jgi:hypothetical protein
MIAMPLLIAGITLSNQKTIYSAITGITGFVGIVLVTLWYGRDTNISKFTPKKKYPTFLYYASLAFGLQVAGLATALFLGFINS